MKHEKLLPVLEAGCFGLLLIILAGSDTRKDSSEPLAFSMLIMGILLIAAIFLILLEACFFRTPKKRMLTLISFKDGHPYHVYEIADEDLFLFCTSKFDLNYLIIDKAFRETINQLSKPDKNSRVTVEKWRRQLRMYSQNDSAELVFLSFNFPGGNQADVLPLAAVPDFTDAAIRTMQANCPEIKIFRSRHELEQWQDSLDDTLWEEVQGKIQNLERKRRSMWKFHSKQNRPMS